MPSEQGMTYYDMFKETQRAYGRLELRNEELKRENRRLREWIDTEGRSCPSSMACDEVLGLVEEPTDG